MPKPMHSKIFAAVETFKYPFDNSQSDNDPNTMLITSEVKCGKALYKPFYQRDKDKKSRGNSNSQSFFVHFSKVHNFLTYCDCVHRIRLENFCNLKVNFDSIL